MPGSLAIASSSDCMLYGLRHCHGAIRVDKTSPRVTGSNDLTALRMLRWIMTNLVKLNEPWADDSQLVMDDFLEMRSAAFLWDFHTWSS